MISNAPPGDAVDENETAVIKGLARTRCVSVCGLLKSAQLTGFALP